MRLSGLAAAAGAITLLAGATGCERKAPATPVVLVDGMVRVRGGAFRMGTDEGFAFEGPSHDAEVGDFWIDDHEVTAAEFGEFVRATGYATDAERFGWSIVFSVREGEWLRVDGADWRHPDGPDSQPRENEPVTQVSWYDADAYARWAGKRLPTEAEWEYAARGGLDAATYTWGEASPPDAGRVANTWQGEFPVEDAADDGFAGRAPVCSFPPNGYGLCDMAGNVWEWCADSFDDPTCGPGEPRSGQRAIRGGSWLCAENYCRGYRVAARSHSTPESAMNNLGFRCVRDVGRNGR